MKELNAALVCSAVLYGVDAMFFGGGYSNKSALWILSYLARGMHAARSRRHVCFTPVGSTGRCNTLSSRGKIGSRRKNEVEVL